MHGFCGVWGTLAAGLFFAADPFNWDRIGVQALGSAAAFAWAFPMALMLYLLLAKTVGLRTSTQDEQRGLDYAEHAEVGYPEFNQALTYDRHELTRRA
ncbi:hypothetical protein [Pseudomonas cavernae]|uniref:hypothetical protein n=1 Tax=Pseudomonas cavernae TaxID=2320867 RepID=UPI001EE5E69F|nr:hypothetical protein [Pseudomonas cavernae]